MTRIVTADAKQTSGADFLRAFAPRPDPMAEMCKRLWNATSREEVAAIHAEMRAYHASLTDPTIDTAPDTGWDRIGFAA